MTIPFTRLFPLLVLLIFPLPSTQVELECLSEDISPLDQAADCRFLLSHLPTDPFLNRGHSPPWSISLPFLPKAYIRHRSCSVQFTLFILKVPSHLQSSEPDAPAPPVVLVWDLFRAMVEELVSQCIEKGRVGYGTRTYSWMSIMVTVFVGATPSTREAIRTTQRQQMEMMVRPLMPWEESDNVYNYPIYDV